VSVTNQSVRDVLGRRIRRRRVKMGFSQLRLAREAGLSKSFISFLERGKRGILLENVLVLAPALGVKPGWFFANH
jgi:transcriptional regulator with XRE-family HTH domain